VADSILDQARRVLELANGADKRTRWVLEPLDHRPDGTRHLFPSIRVRPDDNPLYGRIVINDGLREGVGTLKDYDNLARYVVGAYGDAPDLASAITDIAAILDSDMNVIEGITAIRTRLSLDAPPVTPEI